MSSQPTGGRVGGVRVVGGKRATPPPASKLTGAVPVSSPKFKRVGGTKTIVVGIAACEISTDPRQVLLTYALGSCVGVSIWNRKSHATALLHAMLPDSTLDAARAKQNPHVFVDSGLAAVIAEMIAAADSPQDLEVKVAGGASLVDSTRRFQVGQKNIEAVRLHVPRHGLAIAGEDTGGNGSRTMVLHAMTGRVSLRRGSEEIGFL